MGDISVIEWLVYGLMSYGSMFMTIIALIKDIPNTRNLAMQRCIFLFPGMICSGVLASSGVNIVLQTISTTTKNLNTSQVWTEATTNIITLQSPVWIMVHVMFFLVLFWFLVTQIMFLLTKWD